MTVDPGRPFSKSFSDVIDDLQNRLTTGTEQPSETTFIYNSNNTAGYPLPTDLVAITCVWALSNRKLVVYQEVTYDASGNPIDSAWEYRIDSSSSKKTLFWNKASKLLPTDGTQITVEYTIRSTPSGITDFSPGSIAGTLVRAVAREMTLIYHQIDEAYRRAFLDQAEGVALDNVVALLGIQRNPAVQAIGRITFSVKIAATKDLLIPKGTQVADKAGDLFETQSDATIKQGSLNVIVDAVAVESGPQGNVDKGTITIMPSPPRGVDRVTNDVAFQGGKDSETDDALRERARHALEQAGKGTLNAIEYSVKSIQGIDKVKVFDHSIDNNIPLGYVDVYYSGGKSEVSLEGKVRDVVNDTRPAGIYARIYRIGTVYISGTFVLLPDLEMPSDATQHFLDSAVAVLQTLPVGGPLSVRRLNALAYSVAGIKEVAEAQLFATKDQSVQSIDSDPYSLNRTDAIAVDTNNLKVVVVTGMSTPTSTQVTVARQQDNSYKITVPLQLTASGTPVPFKNFTLHLSATLNTTMKRDASLNVALGTYTGNATFKGDGKTANSASVEIILPAGKYLPNDHNTGVKMALSADVYPVLPTVQVDLTMP